VDAGGAVLAGLASRTAYDGRLGEVSEVTAGEVAEVMAGEVSEVMAGEVSEVMSPR
jgi:hypothetical protein